MARGYGDNERLIKTVNVSLGPAVSGVKVLVHEYKNYINQTAREQTSACREAE
jgi:hypothetical protein